MAGFIEDFYYGNLEPQECSELGKEIKEKLDELNAMEKELDVALSGKEREMFLAYVSKSIEYVTANITDSFISGFRFGAKFALDTFMNNSKSFRSRGS